MEVPQHFELLQSHEKCQDLQSDRFLLNLKYRSKELVRVKKPKLYYSLLAYAKILSSAAVCPFQEAD